VVVEVELYQEQLVVLEVEVLEDLENLQVQLLVVIQLLL
jgi:hypothetical protein